MSVPVFLEHIVEALTELATTLREHRRLRWLLLGVVGTVALLIAVAFAVSY